MLYQGKHDGREAEAEQQPPHYLDLSPGQGETVHTSTSRSLLVSLGPTPERWTSAPLEGGRGAQDVGHALAQPPATACTQARPAPCCKIRFLERAEILISRTYSIVAPSCSPLLSSGLKRLNLTPIISSYRAPVVIVAVMILG